jgi:hypothetical protein
LSFKPDFQVARYPFNVWHVSKVMKHGPMTGRREQSADKTAHGRRACP